MSNKPAAVELQQSCLRCFTNMNARTVDASSSYHQPVLPQHQHHNSGRVQLRQQQQQQHNKQTKQHNHHLDAVVNSSSSLRRQADCFLQQKSPAQRAIVRSRSNGNVEEVPITLVGVASRGMKLAKSVQSVFHGAVPNAVDISSSLFASEAINKKDGTLSSLGDTSAQTNRKTLLSHQPYSESNIERRRKQQKDEIDEDEEIVLQHVKISDDADDEDDEDDDEDEELNNRNRHLATGNDTTPTSRRNMPKKIFSVTVAQPPPVCKTLSTESLLNESKGTNSPSLVTEQPQATVQWSTSQSPLLQLLRRSSNMDNNKSSTYFPTSLAAGRLHRQQQKSSVDSSFVEDDATAATPKSHQRTTIATRRADHVLPRRTREHQQVFTLGLSQRSHHQTIQHEQNHHHHQSLINNNSAPVFQAVAGAPNTTAAPPKSGMEKYEKLDKIGSGSYGSVYKCRNRETGEQVAIKKFFESEDDPAIRKIAYREIRVLKQLNHENIVNLMEVFRKKKKLHLVFEYCDTTLLDHMEHVKSELGGISLHDGKKIMFQVLLALRYIHGHNFIHRDIKPENILLVVPSLTVKLCDFGFARLMNRFNPGEEQFTEYVATRWYRSPELLAGDPYYGPGVDIWAIGCVFPEVVTTQPLFPGQTDTDQLYLIQTCLGEYKTQRIKFKPPNEGGTRFPSGERVLESRLKSTLPAKAIRWVLRALTLDAGQRPDAETLLRDSFMEDIYKQFEDRWNIQTAGARAAQQRILTRVGSGGGHIITYSSSNANLPTERSPSRADKLPELPTRSSQQQFQQHQTQQHGSQTLTATSSETLAMAAKLLGTDRLPGISNNNKPVL